MTNETAVTGQQLVEDAIADLVVEEQWLQWELVTVVGGDNRVLQKAEPGEVLVGEARHELSMAFDDAMDGLFGSEIQRGELVDRVLGDLAEVAGKLEALRTVARAAVDAVDAERRAASAEVKVFQLQLREELEGRWKAERDLETTERELKASQREVEALRSMYRDALTKNLETLRQVDELTRKRELAHQLLREALEQD